MAVNLVTFLKDQFTPLVIDQLSSELSESPENIRRTADAAIPAVLGGMARRVREGGASDVLDILKDGNYRNVPIEVSQVTTTEDEARAAAASGASLLDEIFGTDAEAVFDSVIRYGGVQRRSALTIMGLVGSELMGTLGRQYNDKSLSADNLGTLMAGQETSIREAMPAGLSPVTDLLGLNEPQETIADRETAQAVTSFSGTPVNPDIPKSPEVDRRRENGWQRWVMAALGLLIILLIVQKCREPQNSTEGITDTTAAKTPAGTFDTPASGTNIPDKLNEGTHTDSAKVLENTGAADASDKP